MRDHAFLTLNFSHRLLNFRISCSRLVLHARLQIRGLALLSKNYTHLRKVVIAGERLAITGNRSALHVALKALSYLRYIIKWCNLQLYSCTCVNITLSHTSG